MPKTIPVPITDPNYAAWAASASIPTTDRLVADESTIFIGGYDNICLIATSTTTTT